MSENTPSILLDTNIWLDYYIANRKAHHEALALIGYIEDDNLNLLYAATSIKDVFYLVNQEAKHMAREAQGALTESDALACREIAWGCIRNMEELAAAVPVGEPQVWLASHF